MPRQIMTKLTKHKKKLLTFLAALALLVLILAQFPASMNESTSNRAVSHALNAVIHEDNVWLNGEYRPLYDSGFIKNDDRLYFENKLGISDSVFLEHGLKPIPNDRELNVDGGDVIISFSYQDRKGNRTKGIQFSYIFGSLGAQGYEIKVYRSLFLWYFEYSHRWVS